MEIIQGGCIDFTNKKYSEHITIDKPKIQIRNIIYGGIFIDVDGACEFVNHSTGEKAILNFYSKTTQQSYINGKVYDAEGTQKFEITGSWHDEISVKDLVTGETEVVW